MLWLYFIALIYLTNLANADQPTIIIVGAGASGIATAAKLYEYGFNDVTILEAENRIGGRILTKRFDKYWVDIGGQWVHGQENNIAFELASPLDVLDVSETWKPVHIFTSKGVPLPKADAEHAYQVYSDISTDLSKIVNTTTGSIGPFVETFIKNGLEKYPEMNETLRNQLLDLFQKFFITIDASPSWNDVSVSYGNEYSVCAGNNLVNWKDKGYGLILEILLKRYPDPSKELPILNNTILNSEVVSINYGEIEQKVVVKTANGKRYIADHVIVTPSLGVLKAEYQTLFTPALPEWKVKHIQGIAFGTVAKLYFSFEEPWWDDDLNSFALMWDEDDKKQYENDPDTKWLLAIAEFIRVEHKPNLLCGWVTNGGARYMETLSEEKVFNQSFALLNKFVGQSYNITTPVGFLRSTWSTSKHFRGTYSYRSVDTDEVDAWAEGLARPLLTDNKPVVMFAGEASHSTHFSTVHGAIESGFREANRLRDLYNHTML